VRESPPLIITACTCHPVKGKSYRSGKTFSCGHCGWHGDADFNGATSAIRSVETEKSGDDWLLQGNP
jgi:transposase